MKKIKKSHTKKRERRKKSLFSFLQILLVVSLTIDRKVAETGPKQPFMALKRPLNVALAFYDNI